MVEGAATIAVALHSLGEVAGFGSILGRRAVTRVFGLVPTQQLAQRVRADSVVATRASWHLDNLPVAQDASPPACSG